MKTVVKRHTIMCYFNLSKNKVVKTLTTVYMYIFCIWHRCKLTYDWRIFDIQLYSLDNAKLYHFKINFFLNIIFQFNYNYPKNKIWKKPGVETAVAHVIGRVPYISFINTTWIKTNVHIIFLMKQIIVSHTCISYKI